MKHRKDPKKLSKLLAYVLGRHPDEFGLAPDPHGFVKLKDCLKALHEEEGWGYVRRGAIDEVLYSIPKPPIEVVEDRIRAVARDHLQKRRFVPDPPAILYTCVRRRAYTNVLEKGIGPMGRKHVLLSHEKETALRLGKRFDPKPVLLTVNTLQAIDLGSIFLQTGKRLFLCRHIPMGSFRGPALPKEKKDAPAKEKPAKPRPSETPGSYFPDLEEMAAPKYQTRKQRRRDEVAWKSERKRRRRKGES